MKTIQLHKQSGSSLVVVLVVLATLMVVVAVAAQYTSTISRHVQRSNTEQSALAVADSCIDIMFSNWRAICGAPGAVTSNQTTAMLANIPLPTSLQLGLPNTTNFAKRGTSVDPNNDEYDPSYTISNFKVVAVDAEWNALASASATPEPMLGQIASAIMTGPPSVTTPLVYNYVATADVTLPSLGSAGNTVARVRRVFQKQRLSPWNFAIFYVDPLEIHPGPPFTVTGWIHTNSDLFTGHNTLTFADKVTYASDWFVGFKPGENVHNGETPASPNYPSNLPPARDQALQPFGLDATSVFSTTDPNPNNDSYRELIEQATAGYTDPLAGQRYYDQAAIKILVDGSNNLTIKKKDGTTVTNSSTGNDLKLFKAITAAVTTNQTIQDNREGAPMRLTTLDVSSIVVNLDPLSYFSPTHIDSSLWNGIVYITDTSANPSASPAVHRGVRLRNGKVLPNGGFSVASANPVYIQGDYNTGLGVVPSNSTSNNDPTIPHGPGYNVVPSSVVADAVNILSNNWNDANAQSGLPLSGRVATNTTVNTAIIAGIVPSAPVGGNGSYSGGAENFPRFHEDWSNNIRLTYYGSMIELFQSQQSVGAWGSSNVYNPPLRQWYFDTNFKVNPPPGTIMLYSYIKGKWSSF